jgi:hypothetical protein
MLFVNNQTPSQNNIPLNSPPPKSNLPLIIIVFFLVIVAALGGFYFGKQTNRKTTPPLTPTITQRACTMEAKICPDGSYVGRTGPNCEFAPCPTINISQTQPLSPTANWKTYTNSINRFSIKYPIDKKVVIDESDPYIGFCNLDKGAIAIKIYPNDLQLSPLETEFSGELVLAIAIKPNPNHLTINQWLNQNCQNSWPNLEEFINKNNSIVIDGREAVQLISERGVGVGSLVILPKDDELYFFYGWPYEKDGFDKIMSTFKFAL